MHCNYTLNIKHKKCTVITPCKWSWWHVLRDQPRLNICSAWCAHSTGSPPLAFHSGLIYYIKFKLAVVNKQRVEEIRIFLKLFEYYDFAIEPLCTVKGNFVETSRAGWCLDRYSQLFAFFCRYFCQKPSSRGAESFMDLFDRYPQSFFKLKKWHLFCHLIFSCKFWFKATFQSHSVEVSIAPLTWRPHCY